MNFKTIALFTFILFQNNQVFCAQPQPRPAATAQQVAELLETVETRITAAYIAEAELMSDYKKCFKDAVTITLRCLPLFAAEQQQEIKNQLKKPLVESTKDSLSKKVKPKVLFLLNHLTNQNKWPEQLIDQITEKILETLMTHIDVE